MTEVNHDLNPHRISSKSKLKAERNLEEGLNEDEDVQMEKARVKEALTCQSCEEVSEHSLVQQRRIWWILPGWFRSGTVYFNSTGHIKVSLRTWICRSYWFSSPVFSLPAVRSISVSTSWFLSSFLSHASRNQWWWWVTWGSSTRAEEKVFLWTRRGKWPQRTSRSVFVKVSLVCSVCQIHKHCFVPLCNMLFCTIMWSVATLL